MHLLPRLTHVYRLYSPSEGREREEKERARNAAFIVRRNNMPNVARACTSSAGIVLFLIEMFFWVGRGTERERERGGGGNKNLMTGVWRAGCIL